MGLISLTLKSLISTRSPSSHLNVALDDLGRSEEAIQYYDSSLAIDPADVDILNNKEDAPSSLAEQSQNRSTIS
jgi:hypothetical protein